MWTENENRHLTKQETHLANKHRERCYNHMSSDKLKQGEEYSLYINNELIATQELTSIVTVNGNAQDGMFGGFGERPQMPNDFGSGDFEFKPSMRDEGNFNGERPEKPADMSGKFPERKSKENDIQVQNL